MATTAVANAKPATNTLTDITGGIGTVIKIIEELSPSPSAAELQAAQTQVDQAKTKLTEAVKMVNQASASLKNIQATSVAASDLVDLLITQLSVNPTAQLPLLQWNMIDDRLADVVTGVSSEDMVDNEKLGELIDKVNHVSDALAAAQQADSDKDFSARQDKIMGAISDLHGVGAYESALTKQLTSKLSS